MKFPSSFFSYLLIMQGQVSDRWLENTWKSKQTCVQLFNLSIYIQIGAKSIGERGSHLGIMICIVSFANFGLT